jgi:hypothetical protein
MNDIATAAILAWLDRTPTRSDVQREIADSRWR